MEKCLHLSWGTSAMPVVISNVFWAKFYFAIDNDGRDLKSAWLEAKAYMKRRFNLTQDEADKYSQQLWEEFLEWC